MIFSPIESENISLKPQKNKLESAEMITKFYRMLLSRRMQEIFHDMFDFVKISINSDSLEHVHSDKCILNCQLESDEEIKKFRKLTKANTRKNRGYQNIILRFSRQIHFKSVNSVKSNGTGRIKFVEYEESKDFKKRNNFKRIKIEEPNNTKEEDLNKKNQVKNHPIEKQNNLLLQKEDTPNNKENVEPVKKIDFDLIFSETPIRQGLFDITNKSSKVKRFKKNKKEVIEIKRYSRIEGDTDFVYMPK